MTLLERLWVILLRFWVLFLLISGATIANTDRQTSLLYVLCATAVMILSRIDEIDFRGRQPKE